MNILYPHKIYNRVTDIPVEYLVRKGIKGVILDIDNTLTTHDNPVPSKGVLEWLQSIKNAGIKLIALSNNTAERVRPFSEGLGLGFVSGGKKPLPIGYFRCARALKLNLKEVAVVGDQLFTDILGGRMIGILSILVEPIEVEEKPFFKFKRRLERSILREYDRKYGR